MTFDCVSYYNIKMLQDPPAALHMLLVTQRFKSEGYRSTFDKPWLYMAEVVSKYFEVKLHGEVACASTCVLRSSLS